MNNDSLSNQPRNNQELVDHLYRDAATQLISNVKNGIISLLKEKGCSPDGIDGITQVLNSPSGSRLIALCITEGIPNLKLLAITYPNLDGAKNDPRIPKLTQHLLELVLDPTLL